MKHLSGESTARAKASNSARTLAQFAAKTINLYHPERSRVSDAARNCSTDSGCRKRSAATGLRSLWVPAAIEPDAAISPRVAVRYDVTRHLVARASTGAGFRPPYLNELVRGFFIGNVSYGPNPSLIPERSRTDSVGADWTDGVQRWSIDAYHTRVNDAIMFRTLDSTHQQRSNIAQTQTDGVTATYARALGTCSRASIWTTFQNPRVSTGPSAIVGKQLQYVPQTSAGITLDTTSGNIGVGVTASYLGQTYADDLNTQPLGTAVRTTARGRMRYS